MRNYGTKSKVVPMRMTFFTLTISLNYKSSIKLIRNGYTFFFFNQAFIWSNDNAGTD